MASFTRPASIVATGETGAGKSHTLNNIARTPIFEEGDGLHSVTKDIQIGPAALGTDIAVDTPGYDDSEGPGRDQINLSLLVDYLRANLIRAVLLVFTTRMDALTQSVLDYLIASGFKNNVILVCNKDLDSSRQVHITKYQDIPLHYIKAHQTDYGTLKRAIAALAPMEVQDMVSPASLFRSPAVVTRTEEIRRPCGQEVVEERETRYTNRTEAYQVHKQARRGLFGKMKHWTDTEYRTVTDSAEVMVPHTFDVFNVYALQYAERFDGQEALFQKTFVRTDKQRA